MRVINGIKLNEFQNCGEIMVAVSRNKFAMACKFCPEIFTQLQSFMRHLQLKHHDLLEFVKKMEVYAVEELMTQSTAANDATGEVTTSPEEEDINQLLKELKVDDIKWLEEKVLTNGKQDAQELSEYVKDESNSLANMSILEALKDCDISFNMFDSLNESKCIEEEEENKEDDDPLHNTLLKEIQNDWDDSDYSTETTNGSSFNKQKNLSNITKDNIQEHNLSEVSITNPTYKENLKATNSKGLQQMLAGLDDLDVDTLLENLEVSFKGVETHLNNKRIINDQRPKDCSNSIKNFLQKLNKDLEIQELEEELTASSTQLEFDLINQNSVDNTEQHKALVSLKETSLKPNETRTYQQIPLKEVLPSTLETVTKNTTSDIFEKKLNELEILLNIETLNNSVSIAPNMGTDYSKLENSKDKDMSNTSPQLVNFESLNQKVKFRTSAQNHVPQTCSYNISFKHDQDGDFEFKLNSFDDSLRDMPQESIIHMANSTSINEMNETLNEDFNKALAEALGNDESDFVKGQPQENKPEEPLKQELLNLLDQELNEKYNDQLIETKRNITPKPNHLTPQNNKNNVILNGLEEVKKSRLLPNNNISKEQLQKTNKTDLPNIDMTTDKQIKYKKTNLKAKTKLNGKQKAIINRKESLVLKETKKVLNDNQPQQQNHTNMIKGDHKVFKQQNKYQPTKQASMKSPQKKQICNVLNKNGHKQRNTRPIKNNKENCATALSNLNIKQEKLTPTTASFINTRRGERTPLKQEKIFLRQIPKIQEALVNKPTKTPLKVCSSAPQNKCLKPRPKAKDTIDNIAPNTTPRNVSKTLPNPDLKPSPKEQKKIENFNKTPTQENNESNTQKTISPKIPILTNKTSEQIQSQNKCKVNNSKANLNIPLTTPQKIRNLTVKLVKCTPEKLLMQKFKPKQIPLKTKTDSPEFIENTLKLLEGTKLKKIPSITNQSPTNKLDETSIKSTYCKQNFSEASLETAQKTKNEVMQQDTLIAQCQAINKLKTETTNSTARQRTLSIDILPATTKEIHKTPRPSNLNYKSYAIGRTARKKEVLQRMRHIKKQIFKTLESNGNGDASTIKSLPKHAYQPKICLPRKIQIKHVQNLPNLSTELLTPLINNTFKNPNDLSSAVDNSKCKQINSNKLLESSNMFTPSPVPHTNVNEKLIEKKSLKRPATSPLSHDENPVKRPHNNVTKPQSELESRSLNSKTESDESQHKSSFKDNHKPVQEEEKDSSLETTKLHLSDSDVDFLQQDLKANRLDVESILNEDLPIHDVPPDETQLDSNGIDNKNEKQQKDNDNENNDLIGDLLQQVHNEQNGKFETVSKAIEESEEKLKTDNSSIRDFSESQDIELLEKIGLKIIKQTDIQHNITLEELETMIQKAKQYADVYKCWPSIWSPKSCNESMDYKTELQTSLTSMLNEINVALKVQFTLSDLKRLINLINIWYVDNINGQLIDKKKISETTNTFLQIFGYMPKTIRRFYFCEYCEEYFNTKHKYCSHRIKHTGALYPYTCQNCSLIGFKLVKSLKSHESICKPKQESNNITDFECQLCAQRFDSSALLYEHSKEHLKTAYNCAKCELVFATAKDVKNHMAICNKSTKHMTRQCTARPVKQNKVAYSKTGL